MKAARVLVCLLILAVWRQALPAQQAPANLSGADLYRTSCAACHGEDGKGPPPGRRLAVETPDLTECSFASREPDADWMAVIHQGGPVRAFAETMPAFGE